VISCPPILLRHGNSGPSGFSELFVDRWCILTPAVGVEAAPLNRLAAFWRLLGANVETMSAEHQISCSGSRATCRTSSAYTIVVPR